MKNENYEGIKTKVAVSRLMKSVVVMLPTLDEENGLRSVLPEIPTKKLDQMGWQINIWVVDGGSAVSYTHLTLPTKRIV